MAAVPQHIIDRIQDQDASGAEAPLLLPPPKGRAGGNVRGLAQSSTLAINEESARLDHEGRQVYRMGLGQSPFPVPEPVVEALRRNVHQKDYLPVRGLQPLREIVADYHNRTKSIHRDAEDVLIGPGSKELLSILQLCFDGDLLVPSPSWVSYVPQAVIAGRRHHWIDTRRQDGWRSSPEALEAACLERPERPKVLILNYPSNPLGATYDAEQLNALARVARRHGIVVISDEIYGELHHHGAHDSLAHYYPGGTIISGGLSKRCGAGGWRLGTFTFPRQLRWLLDAMAVVASESYTSVSAPIQYAAITAFEPGAQMQGYPICGARVGCCARSGRRFRGGCARLDATSTTPREASICSPTRVVCANAWPAVESTTPG